MDTPLLITPRKKNSGRILYKMSDPKSSVSMVLLEESEDTKLDVTLEKTEIDNEEAPPSE